MQPAAIRSLDWPRATLWTANKKQKKRRGKEGEGGERKRERQKRQFYRRNRNVSYCAKPSIFTYDTVRCIALSVMATMYIHRVPLHSYIDLHRSYYILARLQLPIRRS